MLESLRQKKINRLDLKLTFGFFMAHVFFLILFSGFIAFSPDEKGYVNTFATIYSLDREIATKGQSGWINTPTFFL